MEVKYNMKNIISRACPEMIPCFASIMFA